MPIHDAYTGAESLRPRLFLPSSPVDYLIDNRLLLCGRASQIYTGSLDTLMAHEIGKKREIIVSFEKIFGKTVAERMRIHDSRIYAIPLCTKENMNAKTF